ncbi:MAG: DUF1990 family protein [Egibacteraceae bacterium]
MAPGRGSLQGAGVVLRWPVGIGLASWRYLWRTTPLHRNDESSPCMIAVPPLPAEVVDDRLRQPDDGVGPLFHRCYRARICAAKRSPEELVARIAENPNRVCPAEVAVFRKVRGAKGRMEVADEYVIRMPGPWNGPVRVVDRTPTSFRFATLQGHLEAGQIEFRASTENGHLVFEIESWGRSADRLSDLLYDRLRLAREVQLNMWTHFLQRVAQVTGGRMTGGIEVHTSRGQETQVVDERLLAHPDARRALNDLHSQQLNFDLEQRDRFVVENGWRIDDYRQPLTPEQPGPPIAGGSWETARRLMRDYEFADPKIVRAIYHPDRPLEERDMLLEGRFLGLRFHFGVRVGGVVDETRAIEGRDVRAWGWNYRTLQGHLEMGQMDYEVLKWLDSGEVEFRIHVLSHPAQIPNPLIGLGFRLFGRHMQTKFARHACMRMQRLTTAELARQATRQTAEPVPRADVNLIVAPLSARTTLRDKFVRHHG